MKKYLFLRTWTPVEQQVGQESAAWHYTVEAEDEENAFLVGATTVPAELTWKHQDLFAVDYVLTDIY